MGWSGGTYIARDMVRVIQARVADERTRRALYTVLLNALESEDWDTQNEATGIDPVFDALVDTYDDS